MGISQRAIDWARGLLDNFGQDSNLAPGMPHREPMQSPPKNARSAAFLTLILHHFAHDHASLTAEIRKFCRYLERKYQQRLTTPDDVRVINAINAGFVTAKDISGHTLIPYETVTKLLNELEALGALTTTKPLREPGRGGDRKTKLHWTTDQASAVLRQRADAICRAKQMKLAARLAAQLARLEWPSEDIATRQRDESPAEAKGTPQRKTAAG